MKTATVKLKKRYLYDQIESDLAKKMVFVGGPRQVGKTTMTKQFLEPKGRGLELRYFRDVDGREVDFIITENGAPIQAIECKWNDGDISKSLNYFKTKFADCDAWQLSAIGKKDYISKGNIRACPAVNFLKELV